MAEIQVLEYSDWRQFKSEFIYDLFHSDNIQRDVFIFRGQREAEWLLETSFDRWYLGFPHLDRIGTADKLLQLFKEECSKQRVSGIPDADDLKALALGQHYGLPTRLLDWTESPYVAAFFAFSDLISNSPAGGQIAIWALDLRSKVWHKEMGVEIVDIPSYENSRLGNQASKFSLSRTPFGSLEEYVKHSPVKDKSLIKILVPAAEARIALADLDSMGISHSRIYPEITGCALAAKMKILLDS